MDEPVYWYYDFEIHMFWNDDNELRIEPPIQTRNFRYSGAKIFIFIVEGLRAVSYLLNLSEIPGNIVDPPLITIFEYKSFRMSTSDFMID